MEGYLPEKTCRTCLQKSDDLTSLHSKDDDTEPTLLEKLRFCASMQFFVSERKPTNACAECVRCITEYYDFKRRCELSEKTLEDLCGELSENTIAIDEVIIKEEVGDDATEYTVAKVELVLKEEAGDDTIVVVKKEPNDSNSSCDDDPNWTPCLDEKEDVDEKERSSGDKNGQSESLLKLACETCGKRFSRSFSLKRHQLVHDRQHTKDRRFECDLCQKSFNIKCNLQRHIRTHLMQNAPQERADLDLVQNDSQDEKSTPGVPKEDHPCDECSRSFDKLKSLKQHKKRSHSTQLHHCDQCGKSFATVYYLGCHKQTHEQRKFVCETCGKEYSYPAALRQHIHENHTAKQKVYECKVCGKQYNFKSSYYTHTKLHREERGQYECGICKKQFELKVPFTRHMWRHNKQHRCDICDKLFKEPSVLAKHKLFHVREATKPYRCKLCAKRFSTASAVKFHMSTLHKARKDIKCDVCGMEFYNRVQYAAHYSKHTGIKPYHCDICGKGYSYNQNLIPHRKQCVAQQGKGQNKEAEVTSTSAS